MLISANFFSCKNNTTETKLVYTENNTIKQAVKNKEQEITWTIEIAPERLQQDFSRASANISPEILFNVDLIKVRSNDKAPVFPELDDFGSLDLSKLKPEAKERIIKVCEALSKSLYSGADLYFSRKYIFNYVFFRNDLIFGWKDNFGVTFPEEYKKEIKKAAAISEDSDEESDKNKSKKEEKSEEIKPLFYKWIIGEPFIGSELMQIPVRFYTDCGIIDMTMFLSSGGNYEFYQITIDRWKKV